MTKNKRVDKSLLLQFHRSSDTLVPLSRRTVVVRCQPGKLKHRNEPTRTTKSPNILLI